MNFQDRVSIDLADNGVAQVRFTRGDKMNALDGAQFEAVLEAGQALREMKGLRVAVLSGEGRAFCAGLDLSSMAAGGSNPQAKLVDRTHGNANRAQEAAMTWRKCPVPVIAAVHGVCFGGGLQIASGADIRVVHPATRMAVMEMKWGLVPDMGGYALWRGLVRDDILRELTYTNREFSGEEALGLGFATMIDEDPLACSRSCRKRAKMPSFWQKAANRMASCARPIRSKRSWRKWKSARRASPTEALAACTLRHPSPNCERGPVWPN